MRILVVEDDPMNRLMVEFLFKKEGYDVDEVDNPQGALQLLERRPPHLILLDINFGNKHMNGFDLYTEIRKRNQEVPVIFVTSRGEVEDKVRGFTMGADDYITKPYAPAEVMARVRRLLDRVYKQQMPASQQQLRFDGIELNVLELCVLLPNRKPISVTPTEMKLLMHLMQNADQVVPRDDLLTTVWGENYPGESNIVDSYIRKLRRKIETDAANPRFIKTVRGYGYKFTAK